MQFKFADNLKWQSHEDERCPKNLVLVTVAMSSSWACATCCKSIFSHLFFFCSSPRLGRSSRSSAQGSRFRDSSSSSYSIKNTADIYKKYPGSTSPLESPLLARHMGAEPQNSFKGVAKGPPYCKLTTRHHILRYYVSPNQSCEVFGDFWQKKVG